MKEMAVQHSGSNMQNFSKSLKLLQLASPPMSIPPQGRWFPPTQEGGGGGDLIKKQTNANQR